MGYCDIAPGHEWHGPYHQREYGFPTRDESVLFERLVLEINQAGLSWLTVLKKREAFRKAFARFDVARVAAFGARQRVRLLADAGIVRNGKKIDAAIENAKRILALRKSHGSFADWLDLHHRQIAFAHGDLAARKREWIKLFKQSFVFTGGEITGEFLLSTGYLPGAHQETCPVYRLVIASRPPWMLGQPATESRDGP